MRFDQFGGGGLGFRGGSNGGGNVGLIAAIFFPALIELEQQQESGDVEGELPEGYVEIGLVTADKRDDESVENRGNEQAPDKAPAGAPEGIGGAELAETFVGEDAHQKYGIPHGTEGGNRATQADGDAELDEVDLANLEVEDVPDGICRGMPDEPDEFDRRDQKAQKSGGDDHTDGVIAVGQPADPKDHDGHRPGTDGINAANLIEIQANAFEEVEVKGSNTATDGADEGEHPEIPVVGVGMAFLAIGENGGKRAFVATHIGRRRRILAFTDEEHHQAEPNQIDGRSGEEDFGGVGA